MKQIEYTNRKIDLISGIAPPNRGKTKLMHGLESLEVLDKETAFYFSNSMQERMKHQGKSPEEVLVEVLKALENPRISTIYLPLRALNIEGGCNHWAYEYIEILTEHIKFNKVIMVEFEDSDKNLNKGNNKEQYNLNTRKLKECCRNDNVYYRKFKFVPKREFKDKIDNAVGFIWESLIEEDGF